MQRKILIISGIFLLGQLFLFRDYIFPIQWGQLKVSGLACTCPDEIIINGGLYLRTITPDSLKKYNLNYSEIYVDFKPHTHIDAMGADFYIIKGKIIGKDRVSSNDPWNPKFKVEEWRAIDSLTDWGIKIFWWAQFAIWLFVLKFKKTTKLQIWQSLIPKRNTKNGRISLTFRSIV